MPRTVTADFAGQKRYQYVVRRWPEDGDAEHIGSGERPSLQTAKLAAGRTMYSRVAVADFPALEVVIDEIEYRESSFNDPEFGYVEDAESDTTGKQWVGRWDSATTKIDYEEYA
jgi:hypothetical protein